MEKSFQELDLSNAFLFAAALEDPETCQLVLEIILGDKLPPVNVHAEHSILVSSISELHDKITKLKKERDLEARYMTFEELLRSREKDGIAKGIAQGIARGKAEAILELLKDYGSVPERLTEKILAQRDVEILKKWHKLASKVKSIEEFTEKM